MAESSNGAANGQAQQPSAQLNLQKIYVKDVSFEAPGAPQVFQSQGTTPNVELNLSQRVSQLSEAAFEVVLSVTVTCKINEKTAYLAEVHQAGIFGLSGFDPKGRDMMLATVIVRTCCSRTRARSFRDLVRMAASRRSCCSRSTSRRSTPISIRRRWRRPSSRRVGNA